MKGEHFTDDENLAELVTHMREDDQRRFNNYGHFRVEGAFVERVFVVYKPTGLTTVDAHSPQVLNMIKIVDISIDARKGVQILLKEEKTQQELLIGHVPRRVYDYPIYMSVPSKLSMRWDGRRLEDGQVWRSLNFAVLIKTKNKSSFYSMGNTYMETPNHFKAFFPAATGEFTF